MRDTQGIARWTLALSATAFASGLLLLLNTNNLRSIPIFLRLIITQDIPAGFLYSIIAIAALLLARKLPPPEPAVGALSRNPLPVSLTLFAALCAGAVFIYHNHPLCLDESCPLFQARAFAEGRIYGQFPPGLASYLKRDFLKVSQQTGLVIAHYLPGFALLLTPLVKLNATWLLNPLIGVGILLTIRHLALKLLRTETAAGWAMLFTLASPTFTINSISYYAMNAQLLGCLLFTALVLDKKSSGLILAGFIIGFTATLSSPVRPMFYALPWLIWLATSPNRIRTFTLLMLGAFPPLVALGLGWYHISAQIVGSTPMEPTAHHSAILDYILRNILSTLPHDPLAMLLNRWLGLCKLALWSAPGLVVLAFLGWKSSNDPKLRTLGYSLALTFIGYLFVRHDQGHGWGFRYVQAAWGGVPILAAAFINPLEASGASPAKSSPPLASYVAALAILGLIFGNGLQAWQTERFISQHLEQLPEAEPGKHQVIFIRPWAGYYSGDLVQNDPFLRSPTIYLASPSLFVEGSIMAHYFPGAKPRMKEMFDPVWILPTQPDWAPTLTPPAQWPIRFLQPPDLKNPTSPGS